LREREFGGSGGLGQSYIAKWRSKFLKTVQEKFLFKRFVFLLVAALPPDRGAIRRIRRIRLIRVPSIVLSR